jgi:microcystin degradation protein MlrC
MHMGPTAVLDTGKVEIVVISRHQEPNDVSGLMSVRIDPTQKKYLMLKSRVHWKAGFGTKKRGRVRWNRSVHFRRFGAFVP